MNGFYRIQTPLVVVDGRKVLCVAGAVITGLLLFIFLLMLFDRSPPVDVLYGRIFPNPAAPGDEVIVELKLVQHRICDGRIFRRIIDSAGLIHEYSESSTIYQWENPEGSNLPMVFSRTLVLPKNLHRGTARYAPIVEWWCNPVQQLLWPIRSAQTAVEFTVQ